MRDSWLSKSLWYVWQRITRELGERLYQSMKWQGGCVYCIAIWFSEAAISLTGKCVSWTVGIIREHNAAKGIDAVEAHPSLANLGVWNGNDLVVGTRPLFLLGDMLGYETSPQWNAPHPNSPLFHRPTCLVPPFHDSKVKHYLKDINDSFGLSFEKGWGDLVNWSPICEWWVLFRQHVNMELTNRRAELSDQSQWSIEPRWPLNCLLAGPTCM